MNKPEHTCKNRQAIVGGQGLEYIPCPACEDEKAYWKLDRKLDVRQTKLINELGKILAKKLKHETGCPASTTIEMGITEFFFMKGVEFDTYQEPIEHDHQEPTEKGTCMSQWLILERLEENNLPLPKYATDHSVGVDFAACLTRPCFLVGLNGKKFPFTALDSKERDYGEHTRKVENPILKVSPHETIMIPLGFKSEFGEQHVLQLHVRSSVGLNGFLLANGTGIVDPDYRGELFVCLYNRTENDLIIKHGQRIAQGVLLEFTRPIIKEDTVSTTVRGEGGFGSTGVMIQEKAADLQPQSEPAEV